jgi:hypothetical protein
VEESHAYPRYAVIFSYPVLSVAINASHLFCLSLSLQPDFGSLRAIVRCCRLLEPWVLQCLMGCYALIWIIDEDLLKKIEEVLGELAVLRNNFLFLVSWSRLCFTEILPLAFS